LYEVPLSRRRKPTRLKQLVMQLMFLVGGQGLGVRVRARARARVRVRVRVRVSG